jgi:hypothetical protein
VLAIVSNWRFTSGTRLQPKWNHWDRLYHIKNQTGLNPQFFGCFKNFATSELYLQFSIPVQIISQYDVHANDAVLDAISHPIHQFGIQGRLFWLLWINTKSGAFCEATQPIWIWSEIEEWAVREHHQLDLLRIYHILIQSKLTSLIGAKVWSMRKWALQYNKPSQQPTG